MSTQSTISEKAAITDPDQGSETPRKRMTVPDFMARKGGEPLVCLTSYTAQRRARLTYPSTKTSTRAPCPRPMYPSSA